MSGEMNASEDLTAKDLTTVHDTLIPSSSSSSGTIIAPNSHTTNHSTNNPDNIIANPIPATIPRPALITLSLGDSGVREGWSSNLTNPSYCVENEPVEGWRKEIAVRMNGKARGAVDIFYVTPDRTRRFRNKTELQLYFSHHNFPVGLITQFSFQSTYCVCLQTECSNYVECVFGKAGCNGWVHPTCIGMGPTSDSHLTSLPHVICPLCALYLDGCGEIELFEEDEETMILRPDLTQVQLVSSTADSNINSNSIVVEDLVEAPPRSTNIQDEIDASDEPLDVITSLDENIPNSSINHVTVINGFEFEEYDCV
eukprot:gene32271-39848_t